MWRGAAGGGAACCGFVGVDGGVAVGGEAGFVVSEWVDGWVSEEGGGVLVCLFGWWWLGVG